ncbi:unnamed protein product [Merluccius merluccius]
MIYIWQETVPGLKVQIAPRAAGPTRRLRGGYRRSVVFTDARSAATIGDGVDRNRRSLHVEPHNNRSGGGGGSSSS